MKKYKNSRTGAIVYSSTAITGKEWREETTSKTTTKSGASTTKKEAK